MDHYFFIDNVSSSVEKSFTRNEYCMSTLHHIYFAALSYWCDLTSKYNHEICLMTNHAVIVNFRSSSINR